MGAVFEDWKRSEWLTNCKLSLVRERRVVSEGWHPYSVVLLQQTLSFQKLGTLRPTLRSMLFPFGVSTYLGKYLRH